MRPSSLLTLATAALLLLAGCATNGSASAHWSPHIGGHIDTGIHGHIR